jgi:hypothetical protein
VTNIASAQMNSGRFAQALPMPRSGWCRRIEVFSPKLGRRLSLASYDAYRTWLVIEANPAIDSFTERPCRLEGRSSALVDFWVQLRGRDEGEFWLIEPAEVDRAHREGQGEDGVAPLTTLHGLAVRRILQADLHAWAVPIASWSQIVGRLVSHRRFRDQLLEQKIAVYLGRDHRLDEVLKLFEGHDSAAVEAALLALLAGGRIVSADLATAPLSGATRFRRP